MKKLFAIMFAVLAVFLVADIAGAGGCNGLSGECYAPPQPNTGWIGSSTYPWGNGYFYNLTTSGTTTLGGTIANSGTITDTSTTTATGTYDYSGATSFDYAQSFDMGLFNWFVGITFAPLTTSTTPTLVSDSSVPGVQWASSATASIVYNSIRIPSWMTGSGIRFRALVRFTGSASGSPSKAMNWALITNGSGDSIGSALAQTSVTIPYTTTASQYEITLTPNASAIAALLAGDYFSLQLMPNSNNTGQSGTLTLLGVQAYKP